MSKPDHSKSKVIGRLVWCVVALCFCAGLIIYLSIESGTRRYKLQAYNSEFVVKSSLSCELVSSRNLPDSWRSTHIFLLAGQRDGRTPEAVFVPLMPKDVPMALDLGLVHGERKKAYGEHTWWNLDGAHYVSPEGYQLSVHSDRYEFGEETINRSSLIKVYKSKNGGTATSQCSLVKFEEVNQAIKARQATAPVNKI